MAGVALAFVGHAEAQGRSVAQSAAPAVTHERSVAALAGGVVAAVSAGLLLGGSIAIAAVDDPPSEPITRGLLVGVTAASVPSVAIMAWYTRSRAGVEGFSGIRGWGWSAWSGAMINGALQWALVLKDREVAPALTIATGAMGALAASIHAFDAFATSRRARLRFYYQIGPSSVSARLTF
jgi:hypothetical protein